MCSPRDRKLLWKSWICKGLDKPNLPPARWHFSAMISYWNLCREQFLVLNIPLILGMRLHLTETQRNNKSTVLHFNFPGQIYSSQKPNFLIFPLNKASSKYFYKWDAPKIYFGQPENDKCALIWRLLSYKVLSYMLSFLNFINFKESI